jgi:OmpA-OmpF porin, OOP family
MKQLTSLTLIAATLATSVTFAAETTGPIVRLGANWVNFDNDRTLQDETEVFLGLAYQVNNHWSFGIEYSDISAQIDLLNAPEFDTSLLSLNSRYRYNPRGENSFYWKLGAGKFSDMPFESTKASARLGAGYDFSLSPNFSFNIGADAIMAFNDSRLDWIPYAGLNYFFSQASQQPKTKPVAPKPPKDSDKDGVIDIADQCPNSASGAQVDANGCELDSDNDGVKNSTDACPNTPAGAKVDSQGCRVKLTENVSITLNVQFENNSDRVSDTYRNEISKVANFMRQYPDTKVVIEGHTDNRGAASYNQQLSQRRAKAVMNYLIETFSVEASRVSSIGKGEEFPIATNDTAAGRKLNRRVQAEISTVSEKFE